MLENGFERKSALPAAKNGGFSAFADSHDDTAAKAPAQTGGGKTLPLRGTYSPPELENVDIFRLLDQLEELPDKAKKIGPALVGFDQEQFYFLVLKIRANLPDDMKKAQRVARDSERIVDEARDAAVHQLESGRVEAAKVIEESKAEGRRIVEMARQQAAQMVDKSEVARMATAQANDILRRAETEASEIRKGADDYARDVLTHIEGVMSKAIVTVQRGRESLDRARE